MSVKDLLIQWNQTKWEEKNRQMYQSDQGKNLWPWFNETLDEDFLDFLRGKDLHGAKILDLGTCSGTQAIELAKLGYVVVGSDISNTALEKAKANAQLHLDLPLAFLWDDITRSNFEANQFDLVFDRGCFHSICCFAGVEYAQNVSRIIKPGGWLVIKAMSAKETRFVDYNKIGNQTIPMPYHFKEEQLRDVLKDYFSVESVQDSYFFSCVVEPPAKAYLATYRPLGKT